jgi:CubicO group peptidase (beta-lactamase class C family)
LKRMSRAAWLAAAGWCLAGAAQADPPEGFDARVEQIRAAVGVPGIAVAIVEHGRTTLARGYGVRQLGESAPVDADTIFPLGSVGKAFTTAALAVLVDRGRIAWDDPVTKHMPWFQMYDPWVTREMTVVDLLVHRSGLGLGAGDLMFVPRSTRSRAETVRRLRYIRPATSFRSGYAYDNVLYAAAGQLIEEVSGKTWERFVREDVLVPAGMRTATSDRAERRRTVNRAWPHARRDGPMHGMGTQRALDDSGHAEFDPELGQNAAPAGGVAASANDMGRWIAIQLARGGLPGGAGRLFSEAASKQMWTPRVLLPINPSPGPAAAATPQFSAYALGWMERDYRGRRLITHSGAVFGAQAVVMLVPDRDVGFSVAINCEDGEAALGIAYELLDHSLEQPRYDWAAAWQEVVRQRDERAVAAPEAADEHAGASRSVAAARALRGRVRGCLVRADRDRPPRRAADDGLQADARDVRGAQALAVRHVSRRLARLPHRAGLRDVLAPGGGRDRPHLDARRLAARRFQLRLPGPRLQAGGDEVRGRLAGSERPSARGTPAWGRGHELEGRRMVISGQGPQSGVEGRQRSLAT